MVYSASFKMRTCAYLKPIKRGLHWLTKVGLNLAPPFWYFLGKHDLVTGRLTIIQPLMLKPTKKWGAMACAVKNKNCFWSASLCSGLVGKNSLVRLNMIQPPKGFLVGCWKTKGISWLIIPNAHPQKNPSRPTWWCSPVTKQPVCIFQSFKTTYIHVIYHIFQTSCLRVCRRQLFLFCCCCCCCCWWWWWLWRRRRWWWWLLLPPG